MIANVYFCADIPSNFYLANFKESKMRLFWRGLCKPLLTRLKQQIKGKGADSAGPVMFLSGLIIVIFLGCLAQKLFYKHTRTWTHAQP